MPRILVVDDEEGLREFFADSLETEGHEVSTAGDGAEAYELLRRRGFDLVVTDLKMPRIDGMELLRRVKAEQPDVELVVLTAHGTVDSAVEAMRLGAFEFIQKPISSPDELRLVVRRALERRSLVAHKDRTERERDTGVTLSWGDPSMTPVVDALQKVAATDAAVLLIGESGSGKEVAARALHTWSPRHSGPFAAINCAALSDSLLESELFGHEKGAFTGATEQRRGRLELAEGGTFFLDEVGELKPALQAKLLRVLQEKEFERVGGSRSITADVRWVAATNRDLAEMMRAGEFREDLYHRLAVFPVRLPPLRERREDLIPLAEKLLASIGSDIGRPGLELTSSATKTLGAYNFPGNIRELRNVLERAAILSGGTTVDTGHLVLDPNLSQPSSDVLDGSLAEIERAAIEHALAGCGGNRKQAAAKLGIGLRTLYDKIKRYKIS